MSGWGIPGRLRMNPPVSRWAVAPSPEESHEDKAEEPVRLWQVGQLFPCPLLPYVSLPGLGAWHQGLSITVFFLQVAIPSITTSNASYVPKMRGFRSAKATCFMSPSHILLSGHHLEQGPSSTCATASCPFTAACKAGPWCPHLADRKMGSNGCHLTSYLATEAHLS